MTTTTATGPRRLRPRPRRPRLAGALALGLLLSACAGGAGDGAGAPAGSEDGALVVATTSILGDIVGELVDDDGTVEVLMPPGTDPHAFEASARHAALMRDADLVVANGLGLEESLRSALEAAEEDGVEVLRVAEHLDPLGFDWSGPDDHAHGDDEPAPEGDGDAAEEDEHTAAEDDGAGGADAPRDPHVWHDPVRMADGATLIAEHLAEVAEGVEPAAWERRGQEYADRLRAVHDEIEELLAAVPEERRQLVTNHEAFGYLAARYDFAVLGTVIPGASTDAETDPQGLSELVETVERAGVSVVFSETTESDRLAEQLASEVAGRGGLDVEVVALYSGSLGEPGSDAETYPDLLRANARRIAEALG